MNLYYDNKSAINIAHNLIQHEKTKRVKIKRHFIKEKLKEGLIYIYMPYDTSEHQLTDVPTK